MAPTASQRLRAEIGWARTGSSETSKEGDEELGEGAVGEGAGDKGGREKGEGKRGKRRVARCAGALGGYPRERGGRGQGCERGRGGEPAR